MLPTIADALDIRLPFEVDGRSLLDPEPRPVTKLETFSTENRSVTMDVADFEAQRRNALASRTTGRCSAPGATASTASALRPTCSDDA